MTPQEIAEKWIADKGEIRPVIKDITYQDPYCLEERHYEVDLNHTYPCPTLADSEYKGEDLEFYKPPYEGERPPKCIRLKQPPALVTTDTRFESPAIDAWEAVEQAFYKWEKSLQHGYGRMEIWKAAHTHALKGYVKVDEVVAVLERYSEQPVIYKSEIQQAITQIKNLSK